MNTITLGRHARRRMRLYRIPVEQVAAAVQTPDWVAPSTKGRYNAYKRFPKWSLRVTYRAFTERIEVVTVTLRRKGWSKL